MQQTAHPTTHPPAFPLKMLHQRSSAYSRTKPSLCYGRQIEGVGSKPDENNGLGMEQGAGKYWTGLGVRKWGRGRSGGVCDCILPTRQ